ncbi:hypothetical protein KY348_05990 [Candidatus Woesearchaeota archaeon]|nr:hypothetical protein [Candidatus Woesearchaeota archaeon]
MTRIIAHRGFSGKYPENTLLAVKRAVDIGADWVEVDARLSKDNQFVLMHDKKLNRTTNGKGRVSGKTFQNIKKFQIKKRNLSIPSLEEVLEVINKNRPKINIEIKTWRAALPLVKLIKRHKIKNKVVVSSGSITALKIVRNETPSLKTAYLFFNSNYPKWDYFATSIAKLSFKLTHFMILFVAKSAEVDFVNISYPFATKRFIKKLHKRGYKVNVWTVNTKALMKKLIKRKVDGIITDHPDKLKKLLKKKPKPRRRLIRLRRRKR